MAQMDHADQSFNLRSSRITKDFILVSTISDAESTFHSFSGWNYFVICSDVFCAVCCFSSKRNKIEMMNHCFRNRSSSVQEFSAFGSSAQAMKIYLVWIVLIGFLASIMGLSIYRYFAGQKVGSKLPVYGKVPEFSFIECSGKPFESKDLQGKVWIADFIFTRCGGPCPLMSSRMAQLQKALKSVQNIRFISFSVDPEHDSPQVLAEYAKRYDADKNRWFFLTGDRILLQKLARETFKLTIEKNTEKTPGDDSNDILHSTYFILVDSQGRIRGYYNLSEENPRPVNEMIQKISADAIALTQENPP